MKRRTPTYFAQGDKFQTSYVGSRTSGTLHGIVGNCPFVLRLAVPYEGKLAAILRSVHLRTDCSSGGDSRTQALPGRLQVQRRNHAVLRRAYGRYVRPAGLFAAGRGAGETLRELAYLPFLLGESKT